MIDTSLASREQLIELLSMTDKWTSPTDNKFHLYTPNPVMEFFHKSFAQTRCIFGGNRSGKSFATMIEAAMMFMGVAPSTIAADVPIRRLAGNLRIRICTIDYPNNFVKVIWELIKILIPSDKIADIVKEQGRIKAITNSKGGFIEFMQYEQDTRKFQGSSRHVIIYDEEPPISIRDENLMRLVDTDGEEIFGLTPVSEIDRPLIWIYDALYEKASRIVEKDKETSIIIDNMNPLGDKDIHVFFSNIYDNISIKKESADKILSKFPIEERTVREKGHFMMQSGRVYKEYNDAIHLCEEFSWWENPSDYTLYVAIDPHPRTPHAVLFMVARRDGELFIVDELFISALPKEFIAAIKIKCRNVIPELILLDPLAWTRDPSSGRCLAYDFIDAGLNNPMPMQAPKDLVHGILKTKEILTPDHNKKSQIHIFNTLTRFRYEITHYVWDSWKKDTSMTKSPKQTPVDKDDHMMENLYRLILMSPSYKSSLTEKQVLENYKISKSGEGRNASTGY